LDSDEFVLKKLPINLLLLVSIITSLLLTGSLPAISKMTSASSISVGRYDKIKNCTTDLSKRPTSREYLTYFNCGHVTTSLGGETTRDFTLIIDENQKIPISDEGHVFDGWTFNGTIPGPTMRVTQGDHVRIKVVNSAGNQHPHSLHLHSIHAAAVDGVSMGGYDGGAIPPGGSFVYEFIAQPYGVFPYHCHVNPVADHINRGLYGMMIIDPKVPRPQMTEFVMLMNGYDLNFDQEGPITIPSVDESNNDQDSKSPVLKVSHDDHLQGDGDKIQIDGGKDKQLKQAVQLKSDDKNTLVNKDTKSSDENKATQNSERVQDKSSTSKGNAVKKGTEIQKGDTQGGSADKADFQRDNEIYSVNGKAFDYMTHPITLQTGKPYRIYLVNMLEFDLVNSFHLHGTMYNYTVAGTEETPNYMTDIVTLSQGDRGIIEFKYDYPGEYMFHAHQVEFTDKGWMGLFDVKSNTTANKGQIQAASGMADMAS
jgi:FtsP/CotA-like multicopper oxidase with cupredoxin domain